MCSYLLDQIQTLFNLYLSRIISMEVYVLYGSQTGNSEDIAKDIFTKCQEVGIPSTCSALNDIKKMEMKGRAKCLVIVCSTTGNGDAPENADGWWRQTKLRSAVRIFSTRFVCDIQLSITAKFPIFRRKILMQMCHLRFLGWAIPTTINFATW